MRLVKVSGSTPNPKRTTRHMKSKIVHESGRDEEGTPEDQKRWRQASILTIMDFTNANPLYVPVSITTKRFYH